MAVEACREAWQVQHMATRAAQYRVREHTFLPLWATPKRKRTGPKVIHTLVRITPDRIDAAMNAIGF
jgi:hypothetical protein